MSAAASTPTTAASRPQVHAALRARDATIAVAESLTGGLLGGALTDVAGSSATFRGGVVAYATELKASLLGVDPDLLARHGAVHPEVAAAMARGVARPAAGDLRAGDDRRGRTGPAGRSRAR